MASSNKNASQTDPKLAELEAEVVRLMEQVDQKDQLIDRKNSRIAELEAEVAMLRTKLDDSTTVAAQVTGVVRASEGQVSRVEFEKIVKENPAQVFVVLEDFHGSEGLINKAAQLEARQYPSMGWWIDAGLRVMPKARTAQEIAEAERLREEAKRAAEREVAEAEAKLAALKKRVAAA